MPEPTDMNHPKTFRELQGLTEREASRNASFTRSIETQARFWDGTFGLPVLGESIRIRMLSAGVEPATAREYAESTMSWMRQLGQRWAEVEAAMDEVNKVFGSIEHNVAAIRHRSQRASSDRAR